MPSYIGSNDIEKLFYFRLELLKGLPLMGPNFTALDISDYDFLATANANLHFKF